MENPWDNDPIVGANPWDADPVVDDGPGLELDIIGGTPVSSQQFERDNPTEGMGQYQRYVAGLGQSLDTMGRGLRDVGTDAARYFVEANPMLFDESTAQGLRDMRERQMAQEAERREINAPLQSTAAGQLGNIVGTAGQLIGPALPLRGTTAARALLPQTVKGNAALGAGVGFVQPIAEEGERGTNTTIGTLAGGVGAKVAGALQQFTPGARQAMRTAQDMGIDLKATPGEQVTQAAGASRQLVPPEKGVNLPPLRDALKVERETARREASALFDVAQATDARVTIPQVQALSQTARSTLSDAGFDVGAMPGVSRRLDELDQIATMPNAREAKLKAMEAWRKRISSMSPKDGSPEQAAASVLKRNYDEWITRQFNDDMIVGDKAAVAAWRDARDAWAQYRQTFDANKVVRDLATKPELTQEQMRGWILNASSLGAKREAGAIVGRLNKILGPDSPQMAGLRGEVLADIAEPLMRPTPNIGKFVEAYDKFLANNPTLKRELFPKGLGEFDNLVKFARGISQRPGAQVTPPQARGIWDKALGQLTRYMFGHGIARGGVRVRTATSIVERLRDSTVGASARKNILREYLGTDPTQPMFPAGAGVVPASAATRRDSGPVVSPALAE